MEDRVRGLYNNDSIDVKLNISGDDVVIGANTKGVFFKIPFKTLFSKIEQIEKKYRNVEEVSEESVKNLISSGGASLLVKARFDIDLSDSYEYGSDRDGNRGENRRDYEGVNEDSFEFVDIKLFIFDEEGFNIDPHDDALMVLDKDDNHQELKDYVIEMVNQDPSKYEE